MSFSDASAAGPVAAAEGAPTVIDVADVSKSFQIYERPEHRLWQALLRGRRQFYRDFLALDRVSLRVRKGEIIGIVGKNGSGKSTLLQIICGTLTPTHGSVSTQGRVAAILELGSGFNPEFTGRENVYFNGAILGLTARELDARYDAIVQFAEIGEFIDQPIKTYSTGMIVRLAFAVIAHVDADILVIDEALAVGDAFFVQKCMRFLRAFMRTGTILFVSHDTSAIVNLCQRALWLRDGRIEMDGTAREVTEAYLEEIAEAVAPPPADAVAGSQVVRATPPDRAPAVAEALSGRSFGKGGARVVSVSLGDDQGRAIHSVAGGETVTLRVMCRVEAGLEKPIVGFLVKDRLGQVLFGENTFERHKDEVLRATTGVEIDARFTFVMPILAPGDYTVAVAVADGTQAMHVQHHWVHDALAFRSVAPPEVTGLMGVPMQGVRLEIRWPS